MAKPGKRAQISLTMSGNSTLIKQVSEALRTALERMPTAQRPDVTSRDVGRWEQDGGWYQDVEGGWSQAGGWVLDLEGRITHDEVRPLEAVLRDVQVALERAKQVER
jgi:hypothetical protein